MLLKFGGGEGGRSDARIKTCQTRALHWAASQPLIYLLSNGLSSSVKNVTAFPLFPALPVRPRRKQTTSSWFLFFTGRKLSRFTSWSLRVEEMAQWMYQVKTRIQTPRIHGKVRSPKMCLQSLCSYVKMGGREQGINPWKFTGSYPMHTIRTRKSLPQS